MAARSLAALCLFSTNRFRPRSIARPHPLSLLLPEICVIFLLTSLPLLCIMLSMSETSISKDFEILNAALTTARTTLDDLLRKRQDIDRQILSYQRTVDSLSEILEKEHEAELPPSLMPSDSDASQTIGLTRAVRNILFEKGTPIGPTAVRDALIASGVNMEKYSSQMVVVHNTLKRLCASGEVERVPTSNGTAFQYVWVGPVAAAMKREQRPSILNIARKFGKEK